MVLPSEHRTRHAFFVGIVGAIIGGALVVGCWGLALRDHWLGAAALQPTSHADTTDGLAEIDARLVRVEASVDSLAGVIASIANQSRRAAAEDRARAPADIPQELSALPHELRQVQDQLADVARRLDALQSEQVRSRTVGTSSRDDSRRVDALESSVRDLAARVAAHDEVVRPGHDSAYSDLRDVESSLDRVRDDVKGLDRRIQRLESH